jgi:hypothetical protein
VFGWKVDDGCLREHRRGNRGHRGKREELFGEICVILVSVCRGRGPGEGVCFNIEESFNVLTIDEYSVFRGGEE